MSSNRREFLTTPAAVTGLGTLSLPLAAQGVVNMPTPRASALITWEFPRLCRGGSRSLTYAAVVPR